MRGSLALLFLAASLGEAVAQGSGKIERIDVVEFGIYQAQTATIEQAPATATGQRNILSDTKLIAATARVEARVGVHFGMRYLLLGQPNSTTVRLTSVTNYPVPGLKKPGTQTHQARGEHPLFATIGAINYRGYVFEQDWELVPGNWTFELWDGKRKLVSQTFQVVKP